MATCNRCNYHWYPRWANRQQGRQPVRCARCRSKYWNTPRRRAIYAQDKRLKTLRIPFGNPDLLEQSIINLTFAGENPLTP